MDRIVLFSHDRIPCGAVLFIFSYGYGFVVILVYIYIYAIRVGVGITPKIKGRAPFLNKSPLALDLLIQGLGIRDHSNIM